MFRLARALPIITLVLAGCAGTGPEVTHAFTGPSRTPGPASRSTTAAPSVSATVSGNSPAPGPRLAAFRMQQVGTALRPRRYRRPATAARDDFLLPHAGALTARSCS